uniref:Uncharacterized protein n=1 Tax=Latimeria chalumnae TaxID=7897 RepID=H3AL82_LATCH
RSNIFPDNSMANGHDFQMYSFEDTASCKACQMLLRGTFFQGYRCTRCKVPAHKECLGRVPLCGKQTSETQNKSNRSTPNRNTDQGLPKMEVSQEYYGVPPPPVAYGPPLRLCLGDIIEITKAEVEQQWWEGRNTATNEVGWFPRTRVKPYLCVSNPPVPDLSSFPWYAGPMERGEAQSLLNNRSDGTYLVRQRVKDCGEYAISIKFNLEVKHIKVTTADGLYRVTDKKAFKGSLQHLPFPKLHIY